MIGNTEFGIKKQSVKHTKNKTVSKSNFGIIAHTVYVC